MSKTLVYTFKTFPHKDKLPFSEFVVFKKLNDDIKTFCQKILETKPNQILGIAKSTGKFSTIEKFAVNKFHGNKKVLVGAPNRYELSVPDELAGFSIRTKPTESFCNLSAFKIKHFLTENNLKIPFTFIHVLEKDLETLRHCERLAKQSRARRY